jgi:tRNA (adenine22-N1)-methyltransferase
MIPLSVRLEAILALLSPCRVLVDVGTDHGLIPVAAVERGIATRAIASDLRAAPLRSAREGIRNSKACDRILILREDGLSALARGAVDAVLMAGMSGELMVQLCTSAAHVLADATQLVLQPNSDALVVRRWALANGWHLTDERMVIERGQFFAICAFRPGSGRDPAYDVPAFCEADLCLLGPRLLARKDPAALRFSEWQCQRLGALVARDVEAARPELSVWQAARAFMALSTCERGGPG